MRHKKNIIRTAGFTLIEMLAATAIIGLLAAFAIPAYEQYSNRARFAEALLATSIYRNAAEVAIFRNNEISSPKELTSGTHGVPGIQMGGFEEGGTGPSVGMFSGVVLVAWPDDGSALAGHTYTLTLQDVQPPLQWVTGGTCYTVGFC